MVLTLKMLPTYVPPVRVVHSERQVVDCKADGYPALCEVQKLAIQNDLYKPVDVTVWCGKDFEEVQVVVYPRSKLDIQLDFPNLYASPCAIKKIALRK